MNKRLLLFFLVVSTSYSQNSGIGTTTPDSSAALDLDSTTSGFLAPRMTMAERTAINLPAVGLMVYNTTVNCYEVFNGTSWINMCCGIEGESGVVRGAAGKIWMAYNLGAAAPASSIDDYSSYGSMYQWGRATDGHEKMEYYSATTGVGKSPTLGILTSTDTPGNVYILTNNDWRSPSNNLLWQGVNGVNNPCPTGYRLPTTIEWTDELQAANITDAVAAYQSCLKLPMSGIRENQSGSYSRSGGNYWTSTVTNSSAGIVVFSSGVNITSTFRGMGAAVRCIKN